MRREGVLEVTEGELCNEVDVVAKERRANGVCRCHKRRV